MDSERPLAPHRDEPMPWWSNPVVILTAVLLVVVFQEWMR